MDYKTEATPKAMAGSVPVFCAHDEIVAIEKLIPNPKNPNKHPKDQLTLLARIISAAGWRQPITVSKRSGFIVKGHGRLLAAIEAGFSSVPVDYQDYATEAEEYADLVADNRLAELSEIDNAMLADVFKDIDLDEVPAELTGYTDDEFHEVLGALSSAIDEAPEDLEEPEIPEDLEEPVSKTGDLWIIGKHRVMCGDSTDEESVKRLTAGKLADFIHADPPYGMGKVSEGVENDDLRKERLVDFQINWIRAFRAQTIEKINIAIWGNEEELWRLWYSKLNKLEKEIRFVNEIVWNKTTQVGLNNELALKLVNSERCLIVQTGKQFIGNVNACDFPDEWSPILEKMQAMAKAANLTKAIVKEVTGVDMYSHWFTTNQFVLIAQPRYEKLQRAFPQAFTENWHDLKTEWAKVSGKGRANLTESLNRAYFDACTGTTDVWTFNVPAGNDRPDHPTPKNIDMMKQIVTMCCPEGGLVLEPFGGSGQTLLGAHMAKRVCYTMELQPKFVDMIVRRYIEMTKAKDIKLIRNGEEQPAEVYAQFFEDKEEDQE